GRVPDHPEGDRGERARARRNRAGAEVPPLGLVAQDPEESRDRGAVLEDPERERRRLDDLLVVVAEALHDRVPRSLRVVGLAERDDRRRANVEVLVRARSEESRDENRLDAAARDPRRLRLVRTSIRAEEEGGAPGRRERAVSPLLQPQERLPV